MADRRPPGRPLFLAIGAVAAIALLTADVAPSGNIQALIDTGSAVILVILLRKAFVTGAMHNPLGANRDFSPAPVLKNLIIGVAFALAAILWAAACGMAARDRLLPDTKFAVYSAAGVPLLLLFSGVIFFLGRAFFQGMFGRRNDPP